MPYFLSAVTDLLFNKLQAFCSAGAFIHMHHVHAAGKVGNVNGGMCAAF